MAAGTAAVMDILIASEAATASVTVLGDMRVITAKTIAAIIGHASGFIEAMAMRLATMTIMDMVREMPIGTATALTIEATVAIATAATATMTIER